MKGPEVTESSAENTQSSQKHSKQNDLGLILMENNTKMHISDAVESSDITYSLLQLQNMQNKGE